MSNCLFCKIADHSIPSDIVFENENIIAFRDIHPAAPQHVLIIPKQHISTLNDLHENHQSLIGKMIITASKLARELGFAEDGYRLNFNCNEQGGQTVYHIHLHLLAGRQFSWPPG
ncbi:MAG: histidine triad nucleotide-binding protein [Pseudomonadota bacterium]